MEKYNLIPSETLLIPKCFASPPPSAGGGKKIKPHKCKFPVICYDQRIWFSDK